MSFFILTISTRYSYYIPTIWVTKDLLFKNILKNYGSPGLFFKKIWEYELPISLSDCSQLLCVNNERFFIHSYIFYGYLYDWNDVDSDYFVEAENYKAIKLKLVKKLQSFLNKSILCGKSKTPFFMLPPWDICPKTIILSKRKKKEKNNP